MTGVVERERKGKATGQVEEGLAREAYMGVSLVNLYIHKVKAFTPLALKILTFENFENCFSLNFTIR